MRLTSGRSKDSRYRQGGWNETCSSGWSGLLATRLKVSLFITLPAVFGPDGGLGGSEGVGGDRALVFPRPPGHPPADLAEIAGEMWNHAPDMFDEMMASGYAPSELTPRDFADVMAFLFVAGYLEEGGDPARGGGVLVKKTCRRCHTTGETGEKAGPDIASWSSSVNPILWAQRLWNHAPAMETAMQEEDI